MIQEFRYLGIEELPDLSLVFNPSIPKFKIPQLNIINPQRRRKLYV
jgi:hypothetical protein